MLMLKLQSFGVESYFSVAEISELTIAEIDFDVNKKQDSDLT